VPLGNAWLVFADERNTSRFYELQRANSHLELERLLKVDHLDRLRAGKHQVLGIQEGSDAGPILMAQYYFSKTAEVDWEKDKVTALGKIFHEVRVKWEREPDEGQPPKPTRWIHPREFEALLKLGLPSDPGPFPGEQLEWEPLDDMLPNEPPPGESSEFGAQNERELPRDRPRSEPTPSQKRGRGRPQVIPNVREVVRELIDQKKFVGLNGKEIEQLVRREARVRFPTSFPQSRHPRSCL
jgi:hypothetical protein